jgi:two-component system, sensor histidine kinase and response regulator
VNQEQVDYLHSAIDSCNEVIIMIDNLLDIHRFETGTMQMNIRRYNVKEIVQAVAGHFMRVTEFDGIKLKQELAEETPEIDVDRNVLQRVIVNLLNNAVKFTPEGGEIVVSCGYRAGSEIHGIPIPDCVTIPKGFADQHCFVMLSVRNTGNGIPAEDLDCIFSSYEQSRGENGRGRRGVCLGLAFCRMAVESCGGVIWVENEAGRGSEFIILLPCTTAETAR